MSATNRGSERREADFYATPIEAFAPLVHFIPKVKIWEPACGDGRLIRILRGHGFEADGNDLQQGYDFLQDPTRRECIVTNPPFSLAFEFAMHAFEHSTSFFLLLRLNFLASAKRRDWFRSHEPAALFVLSSRPDFTGGGGDACDYAWFYWGKIHSGVYHL